MSVKVIAVSLLAGLMTAMNASAGAAEPSAATLKIDPSLCRRLVLEARGLKPEAWRDGHKALSPFLQIEAPESNLTPEDAKLVELPVVSDVIGSSKFYTKFSERLPGASLRMFETIQGTLHCQVQIFVDPSRGGEPSVVDRPKSWGEEDESCWTRSSDFGRVFGRAAAIISGTLTDRTNDEDISVTPWTGEGWGDTCTVKLRFKSTFSMTDEFCGDPGVCRSGAKIAAEVARAYERNREADSHNSPFNFDPAPTPEESAAAGRARAHLESAAKIPEFPIFDAPADRGHPSYSYVAIELFPVVLNGKVYIGEVGHEGVGWRESKVTLVSIFAEKDGELTPLAGYVVNLLNGGLVRAEVDE